MDKELPESKLQIEPCRAQVIVSKSHLPGCDAYKGNLLYRRTITLEDLAERIVKKRSEYRKETLVNTFLLMKDELYNAIEDGFNVDFGFGRTEITVNGKFDSAGDKFDKKRHSLTPSLRPSLQLKQRTARIPAENTTNQQHANAPHPSYVSLAITPRTIDSTEPYNQLPSGYLPFVSIYGSRLKLMGNLPGVGIQLRCLETDTGYFIGPEQVIINTVSRLCFVPNFDFTPGNWEAIVGSQFTPTYHLYKQVRYGQLNFTVSDSTSKF